MHLSPVERKKLPLVYYDHSCWADVYIGPLIFFHQAVSRSGSNRSRSKVGRPGKGINPSVRSRITDHAAPRTPPPVLALHMLWVTILGIYVFRSYTLAICQRVSHACLLLSGESVWAEVGDDGKAVAEATTAHKDESRWGSEELASAVRTLGFKLA